jgi:hypothetical protein
MRTKIQQKIIIFIRYMIVSCIIQWDKALNYTHNVMYKKYKYKEN